MKIHLVLFAFAVAPAIAPAQSQRPTVSQLIEVLRQRDATLHARARACQQLGEFGTAEAVPALAALLPDKTLSAYARSGLEGIPDPSATEALRSALGSLSGNLLIGVINSLGVRRDAQSVGALTRLVSSPDMGVARQALLSLGRISNNASIAVLQRALSTGPEALRPDAASGCLLAAEFQLSAGNTKTAIALYDAVRSAKVPISQQIAGTRGAVLARNSEGVRLLVRLLQSDDRETRDIALYTAREVAADNLSGSLRAGMPAVKPEVQGQVIEALADCCRDAESMVALRRAVTSQQPEVRRAALKALGKAGDRTDAPTLLKFVLDSRNPEEAAIACEALARIQGPEVDAQILQALTSATDPGVRVALIDLVDARPPARAATKALLTLAGDRDVNVSVAALRALRSFAGIDELPALVALTRSYKDGSQRGAAELAMYYAATVTADSSAAGELLLAELEKSKEDLDKASLIKALSLIGYAKALPSIAVSLRDSNSWLVTTTIESLGRWPDATPVDELLKLLEANSNPAARTKALAAAIQLVSRPFGLPELPDSVLTPFFRRTARAVSSTEEKNLLIARLGRWRTAESLGLLAPYLDEPELRRAAANAILDASQPAGGWPDHAVIEPLLERIAAIGDPELTERVRAVRSAIDANRRNTSRNTSR